VARARFFSEYHGGPISADKKTKSLPNMDTSPIPALDREVALARVGGDWELLREIAVLFLENYQGWVAELHAAEAAGDADLVQRTAHGLKGSVANFGARDAVEAALELESLGRKGDLSGMPQSMAALEAALETLRKDLESL
jgi:two-component system, sensor histidine kinase and response regulator